MLRLVFDPVCKLTYEQYTVNIQFDGGLVPSSVTTEKFAVFDNTFGNSIEIAGAIYEPRQQNVVLSVKPEFLFGLDCTVEIKEGLKALETGTELQPTIVDGEIMPGFSDDLYGVSVRGIRMYNKNESLIYPKPYEDFSMVVTVANGTSEKKTERMIIYINDEKSSPLIDTEVTVEANSTEEFTYAVEGMNWKPENVVKAEIL